MSPTRLIRLALLLGVCAMVVPPASAETRGLLATLNPTWVDETPMLAEVKGPREIPYRLFGVWKVSLCVKEGIDKGHAWIRYENVETGEVHTIGRFQAGVSGIRHRGTGEWLYPPIEVAGLHWDFDLRYEHRVREGEFVVGSVILQDPWVFRGENVYGHGYVRNNCVTYARDAWHHYSEEWYDLSLVHLPRQLYKRDMGSPPSGIPAFIATRPETGQGAPPRDPFRQRVR